VQYKNMKLLENVIPYLYVFTKLVVTKTQIRKSKTSRVILFRSLWK